MLFLIVCQKAEWNSNSHDNIVTPICKKGVLMKSNDFSQFASWQGSLPIYNFSI